MPAWTSHVPWWVIAAAALAVVVLAIAGLRALLARRTPRTATGSGLHTGYLVATAIIAATALTLITVAFTMSYAALYESATWLADTKLTAINGGDLRFLFPLGIDAVIVYFLAMDLVMEWQGRRHPLNRWSAYGLSAITIVLNVAQGEGTTSSYLGHAGPPVVIILIAEGVAAWVRHLAGLAHGGPADRIPAGRWIAHPVSTLKVARLMLGSGITSYPDALEREQQRQLAYAMLREQYARRWRRATPRHLKWMLDNGYDLPTAFRIIRAMTASRVAMSAEEARVLLGEPAARPAAPAAAEPARWEAVAIPEPDGGADGHASRRPAADGEQTGGEQAGGEQTAGGEQAGGPATAAGSGERAHTPVFQEPGPVSPAASRPSEAGAAEPAQPQRGTRAAPEPAAAEPPHAQQATEEPAAAEPAFASAPESRPEPESEPAQRAADAPQPSPGPAPRRSARPLSPRPTTQQRRQQVRHLLETIPDITEEEIAGHLGVTPRTARRYRQEILDTAPEGDGYRVEEGEDGQPRLVQTAYRG
ncbi:DUF2637 domain-containing protein [Streptomonospora sp. PA3]|uniref:DUF2637 domain-containing protein n=1 Tax=Streptomonospora sp. PA3 TaxID=2607326 RepID=UPI0012DD4E86|nr:DUF2637 domain-containing protein [Streptomonospora sp. PA3]MUL41289.1 DUF2637 domain-containing protein [Streptomonospora sp. PA3]